MGDLVLPDIDAVHVGNVDLLSILPGSWANLIIAMNHAATTETSEVVFA